MAASLSSKLLVNFVGDQEVGLDIIQDTTDLNLPLDNLQMVVVEGERGDLGGNEKEDHDTVGGGDEQPGGGEEEEEKPRKVGMGEE